MVMLVFTIARCGGCSYVFRLATRLAHGIPTHLDAMGVVHEGIENAVGQRGIADLLMPARDQPRRVGGVPLVLELLKRKWPARRSTRTSPQL